MVHQGERLTLGFETRNDLSRIHPRLEDFQRNLTAHGLNLFGHVNDAEPAFANLLEQPVRTDDGSRSFEQGHSMLHGWSRSEAAMNTAD